MGDRSKISSVMHQLCSQVEKQLELYKDRPSVHVSRWLRLYAETPLEEIDWQELGGDKAG